jgi:hypothetical protein
MEKFLKDKAIKLLKRAAERAQEYQPKKQSKKEFPKRKGAHRMDCPCADCKKIRSMFD